MGRAGHKSWLQNPSREWQGGAELVTIKQSMQKDPPLTMGVRTFSYKSSYTPAFIFPSSVIFIYSPDSASLFIHIQRHSQKDVMQPTCVNTGILQEAGFCLFPHHSAHLVLSITSSLHIIFLNLLPFPNFIPVMSSYPQSKM